MDEAMDYIPCEEDLDDGAEMPPGEPEDYNTDDWQDDLEDVAEDVDEMLDSIPRTFLEEALAPFTP
jgi:hypothetical protein